MEPESTLSQRRWLSALGRAAVQTLSYAALIALMTWAVIHQAARPELKDPFGEMSLTELLQLAFLGISVVILLAMATRSARSRPLEFLFAGLLSAAFMRECDLLFETYVGRAGWPIAALLVLGTCLVFAYRGRSSLAPQIGEFLAHPSYGIMLCGFLIVFVFSRIFGHEAFWKNVLGIHYIRVAKAVVEENTELLGYFLLMMSVIEWARSRRRSD